MKMMEFTGSNLDTSWHLCSAVNSCLWAELHIQSWGTGQRSCSAIKRSSWTKASSAAGAATSQKCHVPEAQQTLAAQEDSSSSETCRSWPIRSGETQCVLPRGLAPPTRVAVQPQPHRSMQHRGRSGLLSSWVTSFSSRFITNGSWTFSSKQPRCSGLTETLPLRCYRCYCFNHCLRF